MLCLFVSWEKVYETKHPVNLHKSLAKSTDNRFEFDSYRGVPKMLEFVFGLPFEYSNACS